MTDAAAPHILVIDDDQDILLLYRDLLTEEGFRVTLRRFPPDGIGAVLALAPDLILLDLLVPTKAAGLRFLAQLKANPATAAIPVLVATAAANALPRAREQLTPVDCGVLLKPFDIDELLAMLRICLDDTHHRQAAI